MFSDPHLAPRSANYQSLTPLDFLERAIEVHGRRPALAWRDREWTYAEFGDLVARMAAWLRAQGVGPGDVVSVMLTNRPELLAAHYAVPVLGAVLNAINTRLTADDVSYILDHARTKLLICEASTEPDSVKTSIPIVRLCDAPSDEDGLNIFIGTVPHLDLKSAVTEETQPIALNYTSGTTGRPKGVVYTHRGAYLNALGSVLGLGFASDTRYLWTLPMFHCNGWTHAWAVTAAGGLHICLDKVEPQRVVEAIRLRRVTHMCCAPVVLYMLQNYMTEPSPTKVKIGTGGAAPTPTLLADLEKLGFELSHLYGLTESYGPATINDPGAADADDDGADRRASALARQGQRHPTAGRARVVDKTGADIPADGKTVGEIVLNDNTLMAGYYRDPQATEEAFRGGVLHTGDLALMHPNGEVEIRDRAKDIIISGGENFSSLEVEALLHQHPDVLLAAVVAAPHPKWGETAWAFIEARTDGGVDENSLDAFCRKRLAGFKRPYRFIVCDLPKTATGKIQKFALRARAREMASANGPAISSVRAGALEEEQKDE